MMIKASMLVLLAAMASAQNLLVSNSFFPVDELIASAETLGSFVRVDDTANRGYIFEKGFKTGFKFDRVLDGGRCKCRKVVPCVSAKGKCFRARDCFDEAKLKRCSKLRECGVKDEQELEKTFKGAVACGTGEQADLSSSARKGLVSRFKEFIDETCDLKACKYDDDAAVSSYGFNLPAVKSSDKRKLRKCLKEQVYEDTETGCFVANDVEDLAFMTTTAPTTVVTTTIATTVVTTTEGVTTTDATTTEVTTTEVTTTEVTTTEEATTVDPFSVDVIDLSNPDFLTDEAIEVEGGVFINGSALIAADAADPVVSPVGWQFVKDGGSSKINWYFVSNFVQVVSPPGLASKNETLGDLVNITFEIEGDTDDGNVFMRIYTKPTGTNDASWYHGSWLVLGTNIGVPAGPAYSDQITADLVGGADVEPVTNTNGGSFSDDGDWAASADDVIMAISFQTDSSTNNYDFTLSSFTVTYTDRVQQFVLSNYSLIDSIFIDGAFLASDVTLEGDIVVNASALIGADAAYPVATANGWEYTKLTSGSSKINWYFVSNFVQVVSPPELASNGETLGDLVSIFLSIQGETSGGQIFIRIYTKPTGTNDASWYHGSWLISSAALGIPTTTISTLSSFKANLANGADVSAVTNDNSGSFSSDGDWADNLDDEIMAISLQTNSGASGYDFTLSSFAVLYANRAQAFYAGF